MSYYNAVRILKNTASPVSLLADTDAPTITFTDQLPGDTLPVFSQFWHEFTPQDEWQYYNGGIYVPISPAVISWPDERNPGLTIYAGLSVYPAYAAPTWPVHARERFFDSLTGEECARKTGPMGGFLVLTVRITDESQPTLKPTRNPYLNPPGRWVNITGFDDRQITVWEGEYGPWGDLLSDINRALPQLTAGLPFRLWMDGGGEVKWGGGSGGDSSGVMFRRPAWIQTRGPGGGGHKPPEPAVEWGVGYRSYVKNYLCQKYRTGTAVSQYPLNPGYFAPPFAPANRTFLGSLTPAELIPPNMYAPELLGVNSIWAADMSMYWFQAGVANIPGNIYGDLPFTYFGPYLDGGGVKTYVLNQASLPVPPAYMYTPITADTPTGAMLIYAFDTMLNYEDMAAFISRGVNCYTLMQKRNPTSYGLGKQALYSYTPGVFPPAEGFVEVK